MYIHITPSSEILLFDNMCVYNLDVVLRVGINVIIQVHTLIMYPSMLKGGEYTIL